MGFTIKAESPGLCQSCEWSQCIEFEGGKTAIYCTALYPHVKKERPVVQCDAYGQIGAMSEHDAKQIGWVIDPKDRRARFKPPKND